MPDLPHGWRMRNSEGEKVGPPVEEDGARFSGDESDEGDSDIDDVGGLDIRPDSEGWNDVEDDVEDVSIKCLLCDATFPGAKPMVQHCKEKHHFDFVAVQSQHSKWRMPELLDHRSLRLISGRSRFLHFNEAGQLHSI